MCRGTEASWCFNDTASFNFWATARVRGAAGWLYAGRVTEVGKVVFPRLVFRRSFIVDKEGKNDTVHSLPHRGAEREALGPQ